MAESQSDDRRQGTGAPYALPSIAAMTQGIQTNENSLQNSTPQAGDTRDSGNWSMQSQSKHSSTVSGHSGGLHLHTILNSEDSPNRFSAASGVSASSGTPSSAKYPSGATQQNVQLPTLNQAFDGRQSIDSRSIDSRSMDARDTSFLDSRRSSVDSRVNSSMSHLGINNPSSPYESTNASQASLASSLQQQRGIQTPIQPKMNGTSPLSPIARRPMNRAGRPPIRAPPIVAPSRSLGMPDPTASSPTKGFAWAFPDKPDDEMEDSSPDSSRHGSFAASSVHTMDSSAYHSSNTIQHRSVTNLQGDASSIGSGSYSRTPELRVSHKLAERKRRSEMKDLFEGLNRILPNSPGNKSSKWEILTKAIDYVTHLKDSCERNTREVESLRTELEHARAAADETRQLHNEVTAMYQQLLRVDPHGHHIFGPKTHALSQQEGQTPTRLAPMQQSSHGQSSWMSSGAAMQGVEYGNSNFDHR